MTSIEINHTTYKYLFAPSFLMKNILFLYPVMAATMVVVVIGVSGTPLGLPVANAEPSTNSCDNVTKSPNQQANYSPHCAPFGPPIPSCHNDREEFRSCRLQPTTPNE